MPTRTTSTASDDLRPLTRDTEPLPVWAEPRGGGRSWTVRFSYAFDPPQRGGGVPRIRLLEMIPEGVRIGGLRVLPVPRAARDPPDPGLPARELRLPDRLLRDPRIQPPDSWRGRRSSAIGRPPGTAPSHPLLDLRGRRRCPRPGGPGGLDHPSLPRPLPRRP
ncbi:MAG: hypothetical protein MZV64_09865 [Ignavibacteriales bacterium]|nr:hypothetical protein [Ignavibacteriales bacterium]